MKKLLWLLLAALFLAGCAPLSVETKTTAFYTPDFKIRGSISVVAAEAAVNSSLEFARYKMQFEEKLASKGYSIASNPAEAQYIAFVSYGIDTGKNANVSTPIFGQTGGGTSYSYGSVGGTSFTGTSYSMPTYGIVGSMNSSETVYTRSIALDIVDAASLKAGHAVKVYEARAKSNGMCSVIAGVFEEMLEALFTEFPGENGKVRTITVQSKGDC
ncbi:DUF4136 domain-containing protein [Oryzomonas sagensis]|uniref:DUF4136 domain-containing protein n=1 Tax=Oryzomonas sagensis TaxID=2603857 RepID=A0ABQ6TM93_9BACT|nr:DUF4136 domain-containing protein [Oryzomonas sagensis]KAB0669031.1 DUF4136 domain-containing protein [Oryzomonas sagensis]